MSGLKIDLVDTVPDFLAIWHDFQKQSLKDRTLIWKDQYMVHYPELLQKQIDDYANLGHNWQDIAIKHVFPYLPERFEHIKKAYRNIPQIIPELVKLAGGLKDFSFEAFIVLYVGIGCGAGWVTTYQGKPAVLMGLENIAECGWQDVDNLKPFICHEFGHLYHDHLLQQKGDRQNKPDPYWQLYREGFAQYFEHILTGSATWHQAQGINPCDWLKWCTENEPMLAGSFLERTQKNQSVKEFFGHWYHIQNYRQCGYYLGYKFIEYLGQKGYSLAQIALLDNVQDHAEHFLKKRMKGDN